MAQHALCFVCSRRLLVVLACLLPLLIPAANYLPDGARGGFIRLSDAECGGSKPVEVRLAQPDAADGVENITPKTFLARRQPGGWILYAGGWPNTLDGTYDLIVRCSSEKTLRLAAVLHRHTRRMDVALLMDDSHSMRKTDPDRLRVTAAHLFARMAHLRGDIETLTLIAFNSRARLLLPPTPPGDTSALKAALDNLNASGATDLDSAFALAYNELEKLPNSRKIAIVLSDGRDEPGRYTFGHRHFSARQWPVYTIGLSDAIDEQTLQMIANSTGGTFQRAQTTETLTRIFRDIAASLHSSVTVGEWLLSTGNEATFAVDDTLRLLSLALIDRTETLSACSVQAPDGVARALSSAQTEDAFADLFAPAAGQWRIQSSGGQLFLSATGSSSLELIPFPVTQHAEPGKPTPVAAFVQEGNTLNRDVEINVTLPTGETAALRDDGLNADGDAGDGIYGGYFPLDISKNHRLAFTATGRTEAGVAFQRLTHRDIQATDVALNAEQAATTPLPPATYGFSPPIPSCPPLMSRPAPLTFHPAITPLDLTPHAIAISFPPQYPVSLTATTYTPDAVIDADLLLPLDAIEAPAAPISSPEQPAAYNFWSILLLILAILLLCWLISRWFARSDLAASRMTTFFLLSIVLHAVLALLLMDLLVQTRVITVEQISPKLAVTLQAVEDSLGVQLTPPGPAVPMKDQINEAEVAKADLATPAPPAQEHDLPKPEETPALTDPATKALQTLTPSLVEDLVAEQQDFIEPPLPEAPKVEAETIEPIPPQMEASHPPDPQPESRELEKQISKLTEPKINSKLPPLPLQQETQQTTVKLIDAKLPADAGHLVADLASALSPDLPETPLQATEPIAPIEPLASVPEATRDTQAQPESTTQARAEALPQRPSNGVIAAPELPVRPDGDKQATTISPRFTSAIKPTAEPIMPSSLQTERSDAPPTVPATPTVTATPLAPIPTPRSTLQTNTAPTAQPQQTALARATIPERHMTEDTPGSKEQALRPTPTKQIGITSPRLAEGNTLPGIDIPSRTYATPSVPLQVNRSGTPSTPALPTAPSTTPEIITSSRSQDKPASQASASAITEAPGATRANLPTALTLATGSTLLNQTTPLPVPDTPMLTTTPAVPLTPAEISIAQPPGHLENISQGPLAFKIGTGAERGRQVTIGLAQYGGDWDWARHAMTFLGHQLRERTRLAINASDRVVSFSSPDLARLPFVYMTGHKDFRLTSAEVNNLRAYLLGGGYLWADDSTHFQDETFDQAFRRELARILPEAPLVRLDKDFEGFRTGYDLTGGFKGYDIPPGDKYRLDYIEGARLGDRVAVVYTRNDYGDGLNIDEHIHPLHTSLTDLSPAEMQEGAVRMGINLTLYFLTHAKGEASFIDQTARTLRQQRETTTPTRPVGTSRPLTLFTAQPSWEHEAWSDAGVLTTEHEAATLAFTVDFQQKCAFSMMQNPPTEITEADVIVLNVKSGLRSGARLAIALTIEGRYYESRPAFIKPGDNIALFPCGDSTFKTEAGGWQYRDQLPASAAIQRITLIVYSPTAGKLHLTQPHVIRINATK